MKILFFALALLSWQHVLVQGFEGSDLWNAFYAKSHAKRLKDLVKAGYEIARNETDECNLYINNCDFFESLKCVPDDNTTAGEGKGKCVKIVDLYEWFDGYKYDYWCRMTNDGSDGWRSHNHMTKQNREFEFYSIDREFRKMVESIITAQEKAYDEVNEDLQKKKKFVETLKKIVDEPRKIVEESRKIVEEPRQIVEEPRQIVERPRQIVEEPRQIVERPRIIVEEPRKIVEEPRQIVERPREIVERPREIVEEPRKIVEEPREIVEEPREVFERPREIVEEPRQIVERPRQIVERPRQIVERPREIVEKPRQIVEEPRQIVERPREVFEKPREIVEEPRQIVERPRQIVEEQKEIVEEPREIYSRYKTLDFEEPFELKRNKKPKKEKKRISKDKLLTNKRIRILEKIPKKFRGQKRPCKLHKKLVNKVKNKSLKHWKPKCTREGMYNIYAKVCWKRHCWCVNEKGRFYKQVLMNGGSC